MIPIDKPAAMQIYRNKRKFFFLRKGFKSNWIGLEYQHGGRDIMWKGSIDQLQNDFIVTKKIVNCLFTHEAHRSSYELV